MQTSTMIKATARSAPEREKEINNLVLRAKFHEDTFVRDFGISINNQMTDVKGRVLSAPKIQYGGRVRYFKTDNKEIKV